MPLSIANLTTATKKLLNNEINESRYNNFIKFLNIK